MNDIKTETALCNVLDEIVGSIDNGYTVALMSLDISAAFDAVPHDILIQRLEDEFGVTGRCCQWIASYLTGRSFTVWWTLWLLVNKRICIKFTFFLVRPRVSS